MNDYSDIIEGVGIAGVCVMVGRMLKSIPSIPDWTIPLVLPFVGAGAAFDEEGVRQGKTGGETIFIKKDKTADDHNA